MRSLLSNRTRRDEGDRVAGLVGLQWADEVQFNTFVLGAELRPLSLRFLDSVFTKHPVAGVKHRPNVLRAERFRDRDQVDVLRLAASITGGRGNLIEDVLQWLV